MLNERNKPLPGFAKRSPIKNVVTVGKKHKDPTKDMSEDIDVMNVSGAVRGVGMGTTSSGMFPGVAHPTMTHMM